MTKTMKYLFILFSTIILFAGCLEGPMGPKGDKGENGLIYVKPDQLTTWGYSVVANDVVCKDKNTYTITVENDNFCLGYWYDVWVVGIDAQIHVDIFTSGSTTYGLILIKPGEMKFDFTFDLTGYALLIITNKPNLQ